jgi:hypothetical protein
MDASTRPPQKRHRAKLHLAASLVAVYLAAAVGAQGATNNSIEPLLATKPMILAPLAHDIGIKTVKSGQEGLELSARFTESGIERARDINWTIRDHMGVVVFDGIATLVDAVLAPDDYQVEATYGSAHILQGLTVHEGTKLAVSFILNAGGLRILPRVNGASFPQPPSHSIIYAVDGPLTGQLITTSYTPGEIIKLSVGDYRIENRFEAGNAVAVTDIHVKAGVMSAVEIDHQAGVARLNFQGQTSDEVQWVLSDGNGATLPPLFGAISEAVLKPGHYAATAQTLGNRATTEFEIRVGETRDIVLGN